MITYTQLLFEGINFVLHGSFKQCNQDELETLVRVGGGQVMQIPSDLSLASIAAITSITTSSSSSAAASSSSLNKRHIVELDDSRDSDDIEVIAAQTEHLVREKGWIIVVEAPEIKGDTDISSAAKILRSKVSTHVLQCRDKYHWPIVSYRWLTDCAATLSFRPLPTTIAALDAEAAGTKS